MNNGEVTYQKKLFVVLNDWQKRGNYEQVYKMIYKHRKSLFEQHLTPNFHQNTTFNLSKHAHINATQWKQPLNTWKSDANI